MADIIRVDFRSPARRLSLPPPPDVLGVFVAAYDTAARCGWAAGIATARLWLLAGLAVVDAAERAGARR